MNDKLHSLRSLKTWDRDQVLLPVTEDEEDPFSVMDDRSKVRSIARANELRKARLSREDLAALLEFLGALTDPAMLDLRAEVPLRVPSGLSVAD